MKAENDVIETSLIKSLFWKFVNFYYYLLLFSVPFYVLFFLKYIFDCKYGEETKCKEKREMPSDEVLMEAHNKICSSSNDTEETKRLLAKYPEALSHELIEWGGSIALHTVCSRQPNNFPLIRLLVTEGLKQNVGDTPRARGGLVIRDYFDRTPLNLLVENNAITTLRRLMQCDPPLVVPHDIIDSRLFNSVHSTYHVDMFRFLVHLNPETISKKQIIFENGLLIDYMIDRVSDQRFLLRILPIMVEEGISQQVGGEYGGGGLFTITRGGLCPADKLLGQRRLSWTLLGPVIGGTIDPSNNNGTRSPILHSAIMMRNGRASPYDHVKGICQNVENASSTLDSKGRMAIHVGAATGLRWEDESGGMSDIVKANIPAAKTRDPVTGLPVYALAAVGKYSLSSIYHLILFGGLKE